MNFDIDIAIVIGFLILTLIVGLSYGRGVKTIEDYALGGRNFSTVSLVATIVATSVTGSSFVTGLSRTYTSGLYYLIPKIGFSISLLIIAYILIPRMKSFMGSISIAHSMKHYYGKKVQIVTAIAAIIANIGAVAVQYKVFGNIVGYLIDITVYEAVIYSGIVVTIYSAFGGIKAVTFTDILQFMIFGTVIPFMGFIIWDATFSIDSFSLYSSLDKPNYNLNYIFNTYNSDFWQMILLIGYTSTPTIYPVFFQRISMGSNINQVKKAFSISAIIILLVTLFVSWASFLLFSINSNVESNQLIVYIIDNYSYVGFKGFMIAGIMAMAMSSADSFINVASVLFINDICKPLNIINKKPLFATRVFAMLLGGFSVYLALSEKDLFDTILFANAFYIPIVVAPLMLTIFGFRTTSKTILTGMSSAFVGVIVWKQTTIPLDPIIPMMILNLIVTLGFHYITGQEGQWIDTKTKTPETSKKRRTFKEWLIDFNLTEYAKKQAAYSETIYMFFGVFCFVSTVVTIFLTHDHNLSQHKDALFFVYPSMLIISTFFILFPAWSGRIRHPIFVYFMWNLAIFYMLTFCGVFFVLLSEFGHLQMIVFTLNLMVLFNLRSWKSALVIVTFGLSSGVYGFLCYKGIVLDQISDKEGYVSVVYISILLSAAIIAFLKPKQEYDHEVEEDTDRLKQHLLETVEDLNTAKSVKSKFLQVIQHETNLPLSFIAGISYLVEERKEGNEIPPEHIDTVFNAIESGSDRLQIMMGNMLKTANFERGVAEFNFKEADIIKVTKEVIEHFSDKIDINCNISVIEQLIVKHDHVQIKTVLHNLLKDVFWYVESKKCDLMIEQSKNDVTFKVISPGNPLQPGEKEHLFEMFYQGHAGKERQKGVGLGLYLCKKIIESHDGKIWVDTTKNSFTVCFSLPRGK